MNILILGARGMLGQALVKEFGGVGYEVIGLDKADLDITDKTKVLEKIGMLKSKIIINAVAYNNIDNAETEDRDLVFKINAEAVGNLVEASVLVGALFVHYSTDYVFRGDKIDGYGEVDAPDPQSVYAKSKFEGEKKAVGQYIIRTSRLFGPAGTGDGAKKSFVDIMLKLGREKEFLDLINEEISSPTYVVDLARATRELIESGAPVGIYHITNSGVCTWYEWAREIFRLANLATKLNPVSADKFPRPAPRPKFSKLLTTKLLPLRGWEEALKDYLGQINLLNSGGMELSIITVTWNSEKKIIEQIKSVAEACKNVKDVQDVENVGYEQIVVDNNSSDQIAALIKKNFPSVKLIENKENAGFGAANNQGVKISQGEFILFLNPDMRLDPGSMLKMLQWMKEEKDVGIASCKLVDAEGKFNSEAGPRRFPKVWEQVCLLLKLSHIFPALLNNYLMKDFNPDLEQEVDSVRGSFMLVRHELIEKFGWGFDPRYFIWFEDVDLCHEAKRLGFKVVYTPIISCVDYFGQSFKQRDRIWKQKIFSRSMLTYFQKWEPWYKWVWVWLAKPLGLCLVWMGDRFSKLAK